MAKAPAYPEGWALVSDSVSRLQVHVTVSSTSQSWLSEWKHRKRGECRTLCTMDPLRRLKRNEHITSGESPRPNSFVYLRLDVVSKGYINGPST